MKIILTYLLNIILYGIVIPTTVFILASIAVEFSCKYYWGEQYLQGDSGFKLGAWITFYFVTLTIYYYLFALINFGFSHRQRPVTVGITIAMPILWTIIQRSMTNKIIFNELGRLKLIITSIIVISDNTITTIARWL